MSGSTSKLRILLYSFLSSCSVVVLSLIIQWLIYEDWLHDPGPVRFVGTFFACGITFFFVWHWQERIRKEQVETGRRFQLIAEMNDSIRNALQTIECITYLKDEEATETVRHAVVVIDTALRGASSEIATAADVRSQKHFIADTHR